MWKKIDREKYSVILDYPSLYVNNFARKRSGHMSHALAEFAPDKLIDFNSNCSYNRFSGHSQYGWIEYRISEDSGVTFSEVYELPYSKDAFLDGMFTVSVEKAVACDDGSIVAFCLRHNACTPSCTEPWFTPTAVISYDGGKTWSEPIEVSPYCGRIYDVAYYNGIIYIMQFCNSAEKTFVGHKDTDLYRLFVSTDNGQHFHEQSILNFDSTLGRGYGALLFDEQGVLHGYAYNENDEYELDHIISYDLGKSWTQVKSCHFEKGIRNPQIALIDGVYIMHGRAANGKGFVIYTSTDASIWDEGEYLETEKRNCYYSNNIVLSDPNGGNRLLIQYSDTYDGWGRVNVMHMWLKIEKN